MNLERIAHNIEKKDNGIFFAKTKVEISYPEGGNEDFMQIEQDSYWFNHRNNVVSESVKKYTPEKQFFDIGGGNGVVSKRLQDDGVGVALVEPGAIGAVNAHKRGIKNIICSTLETAGFDNSSLDSVGFFDVIEHIENDAEFLNMVNDYLKEDGYIYLTVPAYNFLWSNEDVDAGHFRRYSLRKMRRLLKETGFTVVYSTYIFSILPLPIFLLRSIPSKLGLNKNSNDVEKHKKEHTSKKGFLNNLLQKVLNWELNRIDKSKKIHFGSSCFVIAKKKNI